MNTKSINLSEWPNFMTIDGERFEIDEIKIGPHGNYDVRLAGRIEEIEINWKIAK